MLTESEKRAAVLAVHRYGVDREQIREAAKVVLQAHAQGKPTDLLDTLVEQNLLSQAQAAELRAALKAAAVASPPSSATAQTTFPPALTLEEHGDFPDATNLLPDAQPEFRRLGQFRILRRLGEGGMGSVYLGYHEEEGRHVAIKVLADHLAQSQTYIKRFYREAKSVAQLDHPNIVHGIAFGRDEATGKYFMALEYVDGISSQDLLERCVRLPVGDAVYIILAIARALEHAHSRSIVHRDIKPDNILLTKSAVIKLADLGLAKRTDDASQLTATRQGFGTPSYMPYEQAFNAKKADARSDIYALGGTLYHFLTGQVPFPGSNPVEVVEKKDQGVFVPASAINPAVPAVLDKILTKMLARLPEDRYQTASEVIVALERSNLAAEVPTFADPEAVLPRSTQPLEPTRLDLERKAARS